MAPRTVLITGTSTGIGAACVARQAADGWKVYAGVRKSEDGEQLVSTVAGDVVPVVLDVTRNEDIDRVVDQIEREVGSLHGLVNNAGIGSGGPIELLSDHDWHNHFDVNVFGLVAMTRRAMPLVDKASGRFVHVGSIAGRVSGPGIGPYAATKHAVEALNWSLRAELSRNTGMTSSVVEPGEIKTAIWDKADESMVELAERLDQSGLRARYQFMLDGLRGFIDEGQARGIEPDRVARAVEHALTAKRPKARYLVGPDAKAGAVLGRLPDRVSEPLMGLNTRRLERAGRKSPNRAAS